MIENKKLINKFIVLFYSKFNDIDMVNKKAPLCSSFRINGAKVRLFYYIGK